MVMQIGTTNTPADFQGYIHNTVWEALDDFALAYLDCILLYSESEKEHVEHVKCGMQCHVESRKYSKPDKCEFHKETVRYLGTIMSTHGILIDEYKVESVRTWIRAKETKNSKQNTLFTLGQFLLFCNDY